MSSEQSKQKEKKGNRWFKSKKRSKKWTKKQQKKEITEIDAFQRMNYLFQAAQLFNLSNEVNLRTDKTSRNSQYIQKTATSLSRFYISTMKSIAKRNSTRV